MENPLQTENSQINYDTKVIPTEPLGQDGQNDVPVVENQKDFENKPKIKQSTILGTTFMITNICLGTTIFTFAVRTKSIGLVWMLVLCFIIAAVNYWAIMRCVYASSRSKFDDYSEIVEEFMGKRARFVLNVFIIVEGYSTLICFIALIFPLFGRFIHSAFYRNDYIDFEHFDDDKWSKPYIKIPFFIGLAIILSFLCLIRDINKLNFSAYIGVAACGYAILVVVIQCHSYYQHYKDTVYDKNDDDTHINYVNLGNGFTKDLIFFKAVSNLTFAYACETGIFPIFAGFKMQKDGLKKMRIGAILGMGLTTGLHILSIVCSFFTDPITPEDLIIYRKNKGNGKDLAMVLARLFVTISLIFTLPGYYFPLRLSVINSFKDGKLTNLFNVPFTFISLILCSIVSAIYDKILNYLTYIGFITLFVVYLFPALVCAYSSGKKLTHWQNILDLALAIIMCSIGFIAFAATVRDDIRG